MLQTTWFALVLGFWSSLYLVNAFLKTRVWSRRIYMELLDRAGISVATCQLRWYTLAFNRLFARIGQWRPQLLRVWFTVGVVFSLAATVVSVCLLSLLVANTVSRRTVDQQVLTPVMPGINLPTSQIGYYLFTLLVCAILHEVGHAVAAVREQVRVNGFGVFLLLIYPGAFVELSTEQIQVISPLRQLRIYCAGVWHNFVIVLCAALVLASLPWLLVPLYGTSRGAVITHVVENSPVSGPRGLLPGDHVTSIGGCRVANTVDWMRCITTSIITPTPGHCMATSLVAQIDTRSRPLHTKNKSSQATKVPYLLDCCLVPSQTHLCFMYYTKPSKHLFKQKYACLPARMVTDRSQCRLHSDCYTPALSMACLHPVLHNSTKLLRIAHAPKLPLLFLGHPYDLHYSVIVSNYSPHYSFLPLNLPYILETFCKYLISLSGALVILNVVPCYALDGQLICHSFIELALRSMDRNARRVIYSCIVLFGTVLLLTNVVIAMWSLFS